MINTLYFEFIQIALGNASPSQKDFSAEDWHCLFGFCQRQSLVGIGFAAVERLSAMGVKCPRELMMTWYGMTMQIEQRNKNMSNACKDVYAMFGKDGFNCCILKGQGNLLNYPDGLRLRRSPGDIDAWVLPKDNRVTRGNEKAKKVISYVRNKCESRPKANYLHIDMPIISGIPIEVHYRASFSCSPIRNIRLQAWLNAHEDECMANLTVDGFAVPTASVNVVYQMAHIFGHFFDEGIGLRQLLDYYFTLKLWHNDCMEMNDLQSQGMWSEGLGISVLSKEEVMHVLHAFGMGKFAAAVMWVLHEVFAMPAAYDLCAPNAREGRMLLAEIMQGGNFGQYDHRGREMKTGGMLKHGIWKLKRIMRLVGSYPEEALCEPMFRVYHLIWRGVMNRRS